VVDPPVLGPVVDTGQHDERGHRVEVERDRQQERHRRGRTDTGQNSHRRPQRDADQADQNVLPLQGRLEAQGQTGEVHRLPEPGAQEGQSELQADDEHQHAEHGERDRDERRANRSGPATGQAREEGGEEQCRDNPRALDGQAEDEDGGGQQPGAGP